MARNFKIKCPKCSTIVSIIERSMGFAGGKEREEANCPICDEVLYSGMTDGCFNTSIVSVDETKEPYKSMYLSGESSNQLSSKI